MNFVSQQHAARRDQISDFPLGSKLNLSLAVLKGLNIMLKHQDSVAPSFLWRLLCAGHFLSSQQNYHYECT
ncbi:hypothetical protein CUMW_158160 [Citrus unshiu]|uniref:Uncharacterized protein n=1 Tax=Citrus unshiu TaxID=55188 RepID=A0A2H5PQI7_CITUN|nr:hypothetical protein CUMW_158160 [Citrus unshiu]